MTKRFLGLLLACVLLSGCGAGGQAAQPTTDPGAGISESGHLGHEATHQDPGTPQAQPVAQPAPAQQPTVSLVPYRGDGPPAFKLLYPEGWPVSRTTTGENVQIAKDGVIIMVSTYALQAAGPQTIAEMRLEMKDWAKGEPEIKALSVPGAISAFELKYANKSSAVPETILQVRLYGSTYKQALIFRIRTELFSQWEPIFRKMIGSFEHSDLDGMPLGS